MVDNMETLEQLINKCETFVKENKENKEECWFRFTYSSVMFRWIVWAEYIGSSSLTFSDPDFKEAILKFINYFEL
jgi:hypothetical protein